MTTRKKTTNPADAGAHNIPESHIKRHKLKEGEKNSINTHVLELLRTSFSKTGTCSWTPAELAESIMEYFELCEEKEMKPCKSGLRLYLGVSDKQYYDWGKHEEKYGNISRVVKSANEAMETQYVNSGEKNPTMNIFLLKASFGYVEQSKIDVTSDGKSLSDEKDVKEKIAQLGLDKK